VDGSYDVFEILPDGSPVWRGAIHGREDALRKLEELAKQTVNEVRVMHVPTKTVIAAVNTPENLK
jgi:anion-transporting  ArsA/GET3 family ATPase